MLRMKMNKIIRLLKSDPKSQEVYAPKYKKALLALAVAGAVKLTKNWNNEIIRVILMDRYVVYQLNRRELWVNRIVSFILGVATSVLAGIITGAV